MLLFEGGGTIRVNDQILLLAIEVNRQKGVPSRLVGLGLRESTITRVIKIRVYDGVMM